MEFTPEILEKLAATGEGIPIYLDQREPELEDPSRKLEPHQWRPANKAASKLTRCLEAVRDVSTAIAPLSASAQPDGDKRLVKQAVPPLYNLAIAVRDLYNYVQSNCWSAIEKEKQVKLTKCFKQFCDAVPTGNGALKVARDKIGAHLDKDLCTTETRQIWASFGLRDVIGWVRECMRLLQRLIPPDIYSWTRISDYSNVWSLMTIDGTEVSILMKDGQPEAMLDVRLVVSPKLGFVREARELAAACIALEERLAVTSDVQHRGGPDHAS